MNNNVSARNPHLLQSTTWGRLKSHFGWTPRRLQSEGASARILFKTLPLGFTIAYVPKGPDLNWQNSNQCRAFLSALHTEAKKQRAIFLKIEPDLYQDISAFEHLAAFDFGHSAAQCLTQNGFSPADTIQPQTSIIIDISGDEDTILAAMKQKTRYNIRLAKKKGVTIRPGAEADIPLFHHLSRLTSNRDGFGIHSLDYYQLAYKLFAPQNCALLLAEFDGEALAALMVFSHGPHAYYFYGASSNAHRNLMPTYLLQWEAICWAKQQGCTTYDLWGIPNADIETLENEFMHRQDGLWGVYRFKRGFGGCVVKSIGAFDYVYKAPLYKLYKWRRGG